MKTIKFLAAVVLFVVTGSISASAQVSKEDADIVRAQYQKDKKELVKEVMNLSGPKADAFWKVYDAYEEDRRKLSNTRLTILNDYIKNYHSLTNEKASSLVNRTFDNDQALTALQRSYYPKFAAATGAKDAAKFYQIDNYLQLIVRMHIQDSLPFIGEINKDKKAN